MVLLTHIVNDILQVIKKYHCELSKHIVFISYTERYASSKFAHCLQESKISKGPAVNGKVMDCRKLCTHSSQIHVLAFSGLLRLTNFISPGEREHVSIFTFVIMHSQYYSSKLPKKPLFVRTLQASQIVISTTFA